MKTSLQFHPMTSPQAQTASVFFEGQALVGGSMTPFALQGAVDGNGSPTLIVSVRTGKGIRHFAAPLGTMAAAVLAGMGKAPGTNVEGLMEESG